MIILIIKCYIYNYICTVDIEGLLGFIFKRVHNKFHLGLFNIVYIVLSFDSAPATSIFQRLVTFENVRARYRTKAQD